MAECEFKAGDLVRCIDAGESDGLLTYLAVYQVRSVEFGNKLDLGDGYQWRQSRFEMAFRPE